MYDPCFATLLNGVCWKSNAQIMMLKQILQFLFIANSLNVANSLHFKDYEKQFLEIRMLSFAIDVMVINSKAITLAELSI